MTEASDRGDGPRIKICGLTDPAQAAACAAAGADAIGLIFHPPSPRYVTLDQAAAIADALPPTVPAVGVFVNVGWEQLAATVRYCRLGAVQLHGNEPQSLVERLQDSFDVVVIKALFAAKKPRLTDADRYRASAYLVECGRGVQPGGNALTWEWGAAADLARRHPTVLAGGLDADNVARAVADALPDAVDVSSGVEAAPGRKDPAKVARFIAAVRQTGPLYAQGRRVVREVWALAGPSL